MKIDINCLGALRGLLQTFRIPIEKWGTGKAKTLDDLMDEINRKECIIYHRNNTLVREIFGVQIDIHATVLTGQDGLTQHFILKEIKQITKSGQERDRSHMPCSVTEKRFEDESANRSAFRGLEEELHWKDISLFELYPRNSSTNVESDFSQAYPGLTTIIRELDTYDCYIKNELFKAEGYVVTEYDGKTTYFEWRVAE